MFVWRRRAGARWLAQNEPALREAAGAQLAIIQAPASESALMEIAGVRRLELEKLRARFGGTIRKLPRAWLKQAQREATKPIQIGRRLTILRPTARTITSRSKSLLIPAGAAFGTGEHATTAMSLRLLERTSRNFAEGWSLLDLGTGSGILALAARKFGAGKVVAIDSDPLAIRTARRNARLNRISGVDFRHGDVRGIAGATFHIATANLFSKLLIEVLPKLRGNRRLILSGILREQEESFRRALRRNKIGVAQRRRRGKWITLLCAGSCTSG